MTLKLGLQSAIILSNHAALVDIASAVFGAEEKKPKEGLPEGVNDVTAGAHSFEQAIANMNAILNWG